MNLVCVVRISILRAHYLKFMAMDVLKNLPKGFSIRPQMVIWLMILFVTGIDVCNLLDAMYFLCSIRVHCNQLYRLCASVVIIIGRGIQSDVVCFCLKGF